MEIPWPGYDDMTVRQVLDEINGLPNANMWDAIRAVVAYEQENKNRKGVLNGLLASTQVKPEDEQHGTPGTMEGQQPYELPLPNP